MVKMIDFDRGVRQLTGGKVASSGLSLSKREYFALKILNFFASLLMASSIAEKTGSKLGPMTQPYLPFAVALPALMLIE